MRTALFFSMFCLIRAGTALAQELPSEPVPYQPVENPMTLTVYSGLGFSDNPEVPFLLQGPLVFSNAPGSPGLVIEICDAIQKPDGTHEPDRSKCYRYRISREAKEGDGKGQP